MNNENQTTEQAAEQTAGRIKETAREWTGKAKGAARDAGAAADLYVHEYAWTTVALIALTACTVGYLLGRRSA